jgi:hypothetical protein
MGDFSRARDIKITVARQQGAPLSLAINSGTFDHGLSSEEIALVSEDVARVEGINNPVSLQLDANQIDTGVYDLFDAQRPRVGHVLGVAAERHARPLPDAQVHRAHQHHGLQRGDRAGHLTLHAGGVPGSPGLVARRQQPQGEQHG